MCGQENKSPEDEQAKPPPSSGLYVEEDGAEHEICEPIPEAELLRDVNFENEKHVHDKDDEVDANEGGEDIEICGRMLMPEPVEGGKEEVHDGEGLKEPEEVDALAARAYNQESMKPAVEIEVDKATDDPEDYPIEEGKKDDEPDDAPYPFEDVGGGNVFTWDEDSSGDSKKERDCDDKGVIYGPIDKAGASSDIRMYGDDESHRDDFNKVERKIARLFYGEHVNGENMCPERDSNPHDRNGQGILSPSCLPFHHPGGHLCVQR